MFFGPRYAMLTVFLLLSPVFLLIGIGVLADRFCLLPSGAGTILNRFIFQLCLPALIFISIAACDPAELRRTDFFAAMWLSMMLCFFLIWFGACRRFQLPSGEGVMFAMVASFSNAVFAGMPILVALFPRGNGAVLAATALNILQIPMMLLIMTLFDQQRAQSGQYGESGRSRAATMARSLLKNPVVLSAGLGFLVNGLGLTVPGPLEKVCRMMGATVAPCALIAMGLVIGAQLRDLRVHRPRWKAQVAVNGIKLCLYPAVTWFFLALCGVEGEWLAMGVLLAAMPTGTVAYIISETYQVNTVDTSWAIVVSTVASVFVIPAVTLLLAATGMYGYGG